MGEFDLIARYFTRRPPVGGAVVLGVGDDCALLAPSAGMHWAVSSDMLVAGRHFFADTDPLGLGHKALAVNLSDLAACGARPLGFTLALALPTVDEAWLAGFSQGLWTLADAWACPLVGGDTTAGPLTIGITVWGEVPAGSALLRSGAGPGQDIWVSGTLGDAALALRALQGHIALPPTVLAQARQRLERPSPRLALGLALRGLATAALDVSDGLLGDLRHLLQASGVGADIALESTIDLIAARAVLAGLNPDFDLKILQECTLAGGDDYELVFTAPAAQRAAVEAAGAACAVAVTRIGTTSDKPGLRLWDAAGQCHDGAAWAGFDHFAASIAV